MTERELSMKFSFKADENMGESFSAMARAAKSAADEEKAYQKQLGERTKGYKDAARAKEALSRTGTAHELTEEEKYQRALRQRIRAYEQAKRMKVDLARAGLGEQHYGMTGMMAQASSFMFSGTGGMAMAEMAFAMKIGTAVTDALSRYFVVGARMSDYNTMAGTTPGISETVKAQKEFERGRAWKDLGIGALDKMSFMVPDVIMEGVHAGRDIDYQMSPMEKAKTRIEEADRVTEQSARRGDISLDARMRQMRFQREEARFQAMGGFDEGTRGKRLADLGRQLAEAQGTLAQNAPGSTYDPATNRVIPVKRTPQQRAAYEQAIRQSDSLQAEIRAIDAHRGFGMNSASEQARIQLGGQVALNAYQAQLMGNRGAGYERGQAFRDYESTIAYSMRQQSLLAEQKRQAGIYGFQQMTADQHVGTAQTKVNQARAAVLQAENAKNRAPDDFAKAKAAEDLEREHKSLLNAEKELEEAISHAKEMQIHQAEMLNQHSQQRINLTQSEQARLSAIKREEGFKEMGRREHFGLMNPLKQRTYLGIARKLDQGQQLTQKEIEFAGGAPELFGKRLQDIALKRTGKGTVYDEMRQLLPELGVRGQAAEKALAKIDQQFHVEIKLNETAIIDQLLKKVLPEVHKAMQQAQQAAEEARRRMQNQQQAQQRVPFRP